MKSEQVMAASDLPTEAAEFLRQHPDIQFVDAFLIDINGVARGKRLRVAQLASAFRDGVALPGSAALLDITGGDVEGTGLVSDVGDRDAICWPVAGSLRPQPWSPRPAAQMLLHMHNPDGTPFAGDSRTPLAHMVERLGKRGLTAVMACEMEFRLVAPELDATGCPHIPDICSSPGGRTQIYGFDKLEALDAVIADIRAWCELQGVPMDAVSIEQGEGMFEITLVHTTNPLLAADYAMLLKRTIKASARRHGLIASFMAKLFGEASGNGMHVHVSVLDAHGDNIFTTGQEYADALRYAIAGLLDNMPACTAIFAPHANSYRRFQKGSHAPVTLTWGVDNRTTALRVPLAKPVASRIEHRVSGADANPYLVLAAILGGIDAGLAAQAMPPQVTAGNAYAQASKTLPDNWSEALQIFSQSDFIADIFGKDYQAWFKACKDQEKEILKRQVPASEYDMYLQVV